MPRNIFLVNDFGHINGGTAQVAIGDAIALARADYHVTFFCAVGPIDPGLATAGVHVVCLEQQEIAIDSDRLRAARRGLWNSAAARALDKLLAQQAVSPIVHIHGWTKALSGSVAAAALARRASVLVTLHDFFTACPNGGFYQYPQRHICELTAMSAACIASNCDPRSYPQKIYRVARHAIQRHAGHLPDGIRHFVYHSRLVRDILAPYLPRQANFHAVPMEVAVAPAAPAPVLENRDFVMVGRLSPEKGPMLFVRAAALAGIRLVFVGEGRLREAILAQAPDAEVTGWLSRAGVADRLARARALVFPSLQYETFGLTVAEALARGVPAVVPDRSAAAELVEDGVNGLLFRSGDVASLASCLKILKNPVRAAEMGRSAHQLYWRAPLTADRHMKAMVALYESIQA
jgi:glycosyltransferase involved in cell wall biosynthesis